MNRAALWKPKFLLYASSLSCLLLFPLVQHLLNRPWDPQLSFYYQKPWLSEYFLVLATFVVFAVVFYWLMLWSEIACRFHSQWLARGILLVAICTALSRLRHALQSDLGVVLLSRAQIVERVGPYGTIVVSAIAFLGLAWLFVWHWENVWTAIRHILTLLSPLCLFFVFGMISGVVRQDHFRFEGVWTQPDNSRRVPIIVNIFDELDYRKVFETKGISLPHLEAFKKTSLWADHAHAPTNSTETSVFSYLTGRLVTDKKIKAVDKVFLKFDGNENYSSIDDVDNLFGKMRALGYNTSVMGFFLPYCRLFYPWIAHCEALRFSPIPADYIRDFGDLVNLLLNRGAHFNNIGHKNYMRAGEIQSTEVLDARVDFLYNHWPIPHTPGVVRDSTQPIADWYVHNLQFVDEAIANQKQLLLESGRWDKTAVLITSDHWLRREDLPPDYRVPFLLKLPGQNEAVQYSKPFSTLVLHGLLLAIAERKVVTPADAVRYLDAHRADYSLKPVIKKRTHP